MNKPRPRWEVLGFPKPGEFALSTMRTFARGVPSKGFVSANERWARWMLGYTAAEIHEASEDCRARRIQWKSALRMGLIASQPKWATGLRRRRREAQKRVTKLLREQEGNAAWYRKSMLSEVTP
jgi:hypothetical protein